MRDLVAELELGPFEQAGEVARMLLAADMGRVQFRAHRRGVKIWVGDGACPPEHYEAQLLARRHVDGTGGAVLEIGFHSERKKDPENDVVLAALVDAESSWRPSVGEEAEPGRFYGNESWTRVSELWMHPDLEQLFEDDDDLGFELGSRLADYVLAIEPLVAPLRD